MIPQYLSIKGLYSYQDQEAQIIDFAKLTRQHLFGLFGNTGSGKSSTLEAITYCLYGKVERLNDKQHANMVNGKSNSMELKFEFINHENNRYKILVKGQKKKDNKIQITRSWYEWQENEWNPINANAEKIIGLKYDDFCKTVIIPQGKFQEFLNLTQGDRAKMLKGIFNLDKYDFKDPLQKLTSKNKEEKAGLDGERKQYEAITQEQVSPKEEEIQLLDTEIKQHQEILHKKENQEKEQLKLKEKTDALVKNISHKDTELKNLEQQEVQLSNQLLQAESNTAEFEKEIQKKQTEIDRLKETINIEKGKLSVPHLLYEIKAWFKELTNLNKHRTELLTHYQQQKQALKDKKDAFKPKLPENIEEQLKKEEEYLQLKKNNIALRLELKNYAKKLRNGEACPLCGSLEHPHILEFDNIEEDEKQAKLQEVKLNAEKERIKNISEQIKSWNTEQKLLEEQLEEILKKGTKEKEKIEAYKQSFNFKGYTLGDEQRVNDLITDYETKENQIKVLEQKEKSLSDALTKLQATLHQQKDAQQTLKQQQAGIGGQKKEVIKSLNQLKEELKLPKETIGNKQLFEAKLESLTQEVKELKDTIRDKEKLLVLGKGELEKLKKDLTAKTELQIKIDAVDARGKLLQELEKLFRGEGFVNFVLNSYLTSLCRDANNRFSNLTNQQLLLRVNADNSFYVLDQLNGGESRLAETLSGGQKFLASFCLALALADSVQHFHKMEQSLFFIDEGFGSLDKEVLNTVFKTFKLLKKENRITGLISHVEELQQEIDTYVTVTNDPEKGSLINQY